MKTYKSTKISEALLPTMKKLQKTHENPINFLKNTWAEIAPKWALEVEPIMIKNKVLFMLTNSKNATILQYKEAELMKIVGTILKTDNPSYVVEKIKILHKSSIKTPQNKI